MFKMSKKSGIKEKIRIFIRNELKLEEEKGSMTVEACAVVPMFLLLILIVMKVGLYSHDVSYMNSIIYQWGCNSQTYELSMEELKSYISMEIEEGTFGEADYKLNVSERNGIREISIQGEVHGFYFENKSFFEIGGLNKAEERVRKEHGI